MDSALTTAVLTHPAHTTATNRKCQRWRPDHLRSQIDGLCTVDQRIRSPRTRSSIPPSTLVMLSVVDFPTLRSAEKKPAGSRLDQNIRRLRRLQRHSQNVRVRTTNCYHKQQSSDVAAIFQLLPGGTLKFPFTGVQFGRRRTCYDA